jgi:catechol 2,3-dioxygenase-like lactoylglutathione lyase family enzyme
MKGGNIALKETNLSVELNLPPVRQLGIIVKNINRSLPYYSKVLNINPWYHAEIEQSEIYYKDKKIEVELDLAVGYSGALQFELIQVGKGDRNIYTDLIEKQGEGLHHIGFLVSDIDKGIDSLQKCGFQPLQHGTLKTKGKAITRFAYFDSIEQYGYIIELIQTTLLGISVGQSRFLMRLGKLLGDINVIEIK